MAHTPGPWVCDNEKDMFDTDERTWIVTSADGLFLAAGIPWEREADARLIAAAPELLEAARLANQELIDLGQGSSASPALRALWSAIAKAEGRE